MSMASFFHGPSGKSTVCKGVLNGLAVLSGEAHTTQFFTNVSMSWSILGHQKCVRSLSLTFVNP